MHFEEAPLLKVPQGAYIDAVAPVVEEYGLLDKSFRWVSYGLEAGGALYSGFMHIHSTSPTGTDGMLSSLEVSTSASVFSQDS